ncbi:hypothetical protein HRW18_22505 [Streptomyces lunaelactis]|uniref:hypothetical protein n=1 Tax=Streptomyces lunaelactis TaxID=1535768 RepID=UPI001584830A|nr:hypothetical protein [Streptomyces lunaelactis]NUK04312.1 hypothetical protein [Streptomyces lunaelactis]NUK10703.1 hypothetical protein [Streptomyces lunaelactis]NUK18714.1 hypothetical protein [Streptomyces lunaelactis]NUK53535.1 hypothetical protein [Streptomyces lunaelactis]NUK62032.1 hypothetical protein [Streptomyces lunaelactis]
MNVELPLIVLVAVFGYFGIKLMRPPTWLIVVLLLGGFLLADTFLAPAIESGTQIGVDAVNGTTK